MARLVRMTITDHRISFWQNKNVLIYDVSPEANLAFIKTNEFVTVGSHTYSDRFTHKHSTIASIDFNANQAMLKYGYITKKSFE